jgi:hypothetical protein
MNKISNSTATLDLRVGRLEGTMEQIQRDVQENSRVLGDLTQTIGIFKDSIMGKIGQLTQPRWPLIVGFVTLILTIGTLVGGGFTIVLSGQNEAIKSTQADINILITQRINDSYEQGKNCAHKDEMKNQVITTGNLINELKTWRLEHTKENGQLTAQINSLEKQVDKIENRQYTDRIDRMKVENTGKTITLGVDKVPLQ